VRVAVAGIGCEWQVPTAAAKPGADWTALRHNVPVVGKPLNVTCPLSSVTPVPRIVPAGAAPLSCVDNVTVMFAVAVLPTITVTTTEDGFGPEGDGLIPGLFEQALKAIVARTKMSERYFKARRPN
jgi:hypothetical protein